MVPSREIERLIEIMAALRDGRAADCPWDLEQTFATIAPYTIEEAYEVADAIERGDLDDLRDELGDLLLQVVFHARMAEEAGAFDFGDVVEAITAKLIRRHPHVFGEARDLSPDEVKALWDAIKAAERSARARGQAAERRRGRPARRDRPACRPSTRAEKLTRKAATVGFDWPETAQVVDKIQEEIARGRARRSRPARPSGSRTRSAISCSRSPISPAMLGVDAGGGAAAARTPSSSGASGRSSEPSRPAAERTARGQPRRDGAALGEAKDAERRIRRSRTTSRRGSRSRAPLRLSMISCEAGSHSRVSFSPRRQPAGLAEGSACAEARLLLGRDADHGEQPAILHRCGGPGSPPARGASSAPGPSAGLEDDLEGRPPGGRGALDRPRSAVDPLPASRPRPGPAGAPPACAARAARRVALLGRRAGRPCSRPR